MNKLNFRIVIISLLLLVYSSCSRYYVNIEYLQKQFELIDSSQMIVEKTKGVYGETYSYLANPIKSIKGLDKSNKSIELLRSPGAEIIVTKNNNRKVILYFDTIYFTDSLLYGKQSRMCPEISVIQLKNIKDIIWVYNDKGFKYTN